MKIERASVDDAKEILELQKLAYVSEAELYNDYSIPPLLQTFNQIQADFAKQIFLKVSAAGRIVGSVRAYLEQETYHIGRLIVSPDFQNQGISTQLMNEVERHFNQARRYELFTGNHSERNIHLYRKLGYQKFTTESVNDNLTLVFMEKIRKTI